MPTREIMQLIASRAKAKRLALNWSQQTLSDRSGVSYGSLKKFEHSGKISLESLLKIASVLREVDGFNELFAEKKLESYRSIDELLNESTRRRGRK